MNTVDIAIAVLLFTGIAATAFTVIGLILSRDVYERLHYLPPGTSIGVVLIAAAVVVREGLSQAGIKAILIATVIFFMNPILSHATIRAARIRQFGKWMPDAREEIRFVGENTVFGKEGEK